MGRYCCAYNCNNLDSPETRQRGISFHKFPRKDELLQRWIAAVKRKDPITHRLWTPGPGAVLCSAHFLSTDFRSNRGYQLLKADTVPSLFDFPLLAQKKAVKERRTRTSAAAQRSVEPDSSQSVCSQRLRTPPHRQSILSHRPSTSTFTYRAFQSRFPTNRKRRADWIQAVRRWNPDTKKLLTPSPYSVLCSEHFLESDYRDDRSKKILKPIAVPSLFSHTSTCPIISNNMPMCSALYCNNRPHKDSGKSFHRFPHKNPDLMGQWLMNVHRDNFSPSQAAVVCSDHFEESCFDRTQQRVSLRENSIPTIFQTSKHPSKSHDHSAYDPEKTSSKIPKTCAVSGCKQRSRKNGTSLHKFPLDSELRQKWIDALKIENFTPSELAVVCSKHFRDEDLYRSGFRVYLRKGVVPSIFPQLTADLERESESTESPQARRSPRKYGLHRKQSVAVRGRKYPATDQALTSIPPPIRCPQPAELEEARTGKRKAEATICTDATKKTRPYRELRPKTTYTASESLRPEVMAVETKVESGGSHVTEPYESLTQTTAAELPCKAESEALPCLTGPYVSGCNTQPVLEFGNVVYQTQPPVEDTLSDQQPQLQPESSSCMYAALRRIVQHDHSYVCTDSPESLKRQLLTATDKIKKLKQELINANRRNKRCYRLLRLLIKSTRKS